MIGSFSAEMQVSSRIWLLGFETVIWNFALSIGQYDWSIGVEKSFLGGVVSNTYMEFHNVVKAFGNQSLLCLGGYFDTAHVHICYSWMHRIFTCPDDGTSDVKSYIRRQRFVRVIILV